MLRRGNQIHLSPLTHPLINATNKPPHPHKQSHTHTSSYTLCVSTTRQSWPTSSCYSNLRPLGTSSPLLTLSGQTTNTRRSCPQEPTFQLLPTPRLFLLAYPPPTSTAIETSSWLTTKTTAPCQLLSQPRLKWQPPPCRQYQRTSTLARLTNPPITQHIASSNLHLLPTPDGLPS